MRWTTGANSRAARAFLPLFHGQLPPPSPALTNARIGEVTPRSCSQAAVLSEDAPVLFVSVAITEQDVGEKADSHLDRIQLARADVLVSATPRSPTASRRPPASPSRQTLSFLLLALVKEIPVFSADGLAGIGAERFDGS